MRKWRGVWQWVFHRHAPQPPTRYATVSGLSRGASALLFTSARWAAACAVDDAIPETTVEDRRPGLDTVRLPRIDAKTRPIAVLNGATTMEQSSYAFHSEHTLADENATQPLPELAEV